MRRIAACHCGFRRVVVCGDGAVAASRVVYRAGMKPIGNWAAGKRCLRSSWLIGFYCRSTVKRLIEYPIAAPMKTSDTKWTLSVSRENPTSEAKP